MTLLELIEALVDIRGTCGDDIRVNLMQEEMVDDNPVQIRSALKDVGISDKYGIILIGKELD